MISRLDDVAANAKATCLKKKKKLQHVGIRRLDFSKKLQYVGIG